MFGDFEDLLPPQLTQSTLELPQSVRVGGGVISGDAHTEFLGSGALQ